MKNKVHVLPSGNSTRRFIYLFLLILGFSATGYSQNNASLAQQRQARQAKLQNKKAVSGKMNGKAAPGILAGGFAVQAANTGGISLQAIVQSLVGNGVTISNVQCNAPDSLRAVGSFTGGASLLGIDNGLIMTSGSINNAIGPNISTSTSQDNQMPGYLPMDTLGYDATIVDFDLVSTTNLMTFKYVFASEEYNEYVGSVFNDQFSFFITGPGYETPTNIALIPGTTTPVSINNVNMGLNSLHYINNDTLGGLIPDANRFNAFEYDGLTRVLTTTTLNLIPGATYHLKLVVQDVGDHVWDSGVFLQGGSITSDTCVMALFPEVYPITDTGNGMDGRIEVYVSGANGTPHAVWNNGVTEELEIINLGPGTYNVVVTDDAGCVATLPAPIVLGGGGPVDTCTTPATPAQIDGPSKACRNSTNVEYSVDPVPGATEYEWTLPNGATGSSSTNLILVSFGSTFTSGDLEVKAFNACGESDNAALTISYSTLKPATPGIITGIAAGACEFESRKYSIDAVANATSYIWTAPAGVTITNGQGKKSIDVDFAPGFVSGTLSVKATGCGGTSAAKTLALTRVTAVPSAITGISKGVCAGSTQTYTCTEVAGAAYYIWTIPAGAVIEDGDGTNSIVVTFPETFKTGTISVKSATDCYTSAAKSLAIISTPSTPSSITGATLSVCAGTTQTYSCPVSTTGALSYSWTVPANTTINSGEGTNTISVTFPAGFVSGTVKVAATNGCGSSTAKSLTVRSVPSIPASITGLAMAACAGSTQTYACPVSTTGATSYNWTVPAGAVVNEGQGTNSISVTLPAVFASGNITVAAVNSCGQSAVKTLTIKSVTSQPGTISGQSSNLCGGGVFTYSVAAVTGASSYIWTAPANCSIEVNGGNSISMTVPSSFTTGTLSVVAVNSCGNSVARTLSLTRLPATPAVITGPTAICAGATNLAYNTTQSGTLTYAWTVPAGASVTEGQGTAAISANWGTVAGNVSVKAVNACGVSGARSLAVTLVACRNAFNAEETIAPSVDMYPNPGTGLFNLDIANLSNKGLVRVYNMNGVQVLNQELDNNISNHSLDLTSQKPGMYLVRVISEGFHKEIRVVKQ